MKTLFTQRALLQPLFATLLIISAASACKSSASEGANASSFEADGVFVRHVRIRLAPSDTKPFEAVMARCAEVAHAAELDKSYDWLSYRETPGRYWLINFAGTRSSFRAPWSSDPLQSFVHFLGMIDGEDTAQELDRDLGALEYEIEWATLQRQKPSWCTVRSLDPEEYPKARMMVRTIRPGFEERFEQALTERTAFLDEHDYPLPIEGFVTLEGLPGTAMQVLFPLEWSSFHVSQSIGLFVKTLDEAARNDYATRKQALMETMGRAEFYDASYVSELSFGGKDN
ncbi:MAG: hypothetical protein ACI841_001560 [Planctomycetota bacterium]|jgi:hypothetical protein